MGETAQPFWKEFVREKIIEVEKETETELHVVFDSPSAMQEYFTYSTYDSETGEDIIDIEKATRLRNELNKICEKYGFFIIKKIESQVITCNYHENLMWWSNNNDGNPIFDMPIITPINNANDDSSYIKFPFDSISAFNANKNHFFPGFYCLSEFYTISPPTFPFLTVPLNSGICNVRGTSISYLSNSPILPLNVMLPQMRRNITLQEYTNEIDKFVLSIEFRDIALKSNQTITINCFYAQEGATPPYTSPKKRILTITFPAITSTDTFRGRLAFKVAPANSSNTNYCSIDTDNTRFWNKDTTILGSTIKINEVVSNE